MAQQSRHFTRARTLLARLEARSDPALLLMDESAPPADGRLAVLTGSFNPLTRAHAALAAAALRHEADHILLAITIHTVNKEVVSGLGLDERLVLLTRFARRRQGMRTGAFNRGLYLDQARAIRALWPSVRPTFVMGFDKILQVFDPVYYQDRDVALSMLFSVADLAVAPRASSTPEDLTELMQRAENRHFRRFVGWLPLPASAGQLRQLSSTQVRTASSRGGSRLKQVPWEFARYLKVHPVYEGESLVSTG